MKALFPVTVVATLALGCPGPRDFAEAPFDGGNGQDLANPSSTVDVPSVVDSAPAADSLSSDVPAGGADSDVVPRSDAQADSGPDERAGPGPDIRADLEPQACPSGEHSCNAQCVRDTSPEACGATCSRCPLAPNGVPICLEGRCDFACNPQSLRCNAGANACQQSFWGFEKDLEGWFSLIGAGDSVDAGETMVTAQRAHSGAAALSARINPRDGRDGYTLVVNLCGRPPLVANALESLNLVNKTLTAWVFISPDANGVVETRCLFGGGQDTQSFGFSSGTDIPPRIWTAVRTSVREPIAGAATHLAIQCKFSTAPSWTGTIHVDDVAID
jgi:hypothetical protein